MTTAEMEQRLLNLEQAVEQLRTHVSRSSDPRRRWWLEDAGRFANDPVFDEIVRLGKEYRQSLKPGRRTKAK
jgi:hypothetical protein